MNNKPARILDDKSRLPRGNGHKIAGDTTFDRIYQYYFDQKKQIALDAQEEKIRERWEYAWKLSGDILLKREIVKQLSDEFNIELRQAYKDLENAMNLFGNANDQMRKAKREIVSEWLIQALKKAFAESDWRAFEKLVLRYSRINGLDVNDQGDQLANFLKNLKPHTIIITGDPASLKQEADRLMEGVNETTDVEFKTVEDE